jgi:hypothetical protein
MIIKLVQVIFFPLHVAAHCWDCGFESRSGHGYLFCCVLPGRGLCVGLITRLEKSYRFYVSECDLETSTMRWPWSNPAVEGGKKRGSKRRLQKIA